MKLKEYINRSKYIQYFKNSKINSNVIFLEAQNSNSINGNIYYIAKELNNNIEYKDFIIYFAVNSKIFNSSKKFLELKQMKNIILVKSKTKKYFELLATSKYLITDTSFTTSFIKKEGQVIFNTWHGTPLKTLGKKVNNDYHDLGNIQKNFVMADYLLYPSEYMMNHMVEDYMLENICNSKVILHGYPRNTVFFDEEQKQIIRQEQGLEQKEIYVYMPTWRESDLNIDEYLLKLDKSLKENQVLYVKLHPFVDNKINYTLFKNIKKFPNNYETYEFLSIADCLITDYSSVFFDFANTNKKIILFTYDKEQYLQERGLYLNIDELPFTKVSTLDELISEINLINKYNYKEFIKEYCKYDNVFATQKICEKVILNKEAILECSEIKSNDKENVLIFTGSLSANGITTALINLLNSIDLSKRNYFITYDTSKIQKQKAILKKIPEQVSYIPIKGKMNLTIYKKVILFLYKARLISDKMYLNVMKDEFKYEVKRIYNDIKFSTVIEFNGYAYKQILLYGAFECNKVIFVHNDMYKEATIKKNTRLGVLKYAYETYNKVALVTEDLLNPISKIADIREKYYIANNIINYKNVLESAKKEIEFDDKTESTVTVQELKEILNKPNKKFINIGRFSKEKGQERLIDAFENLWKKDNSIYLILIGGYGNEYKNILEKAQNSECKNNIIIIKYVSNPYAILNKCDYFILSSYYEGFGIVIAEADMLGKPVVSTKILGPQGFIVENGGTLVENETKGIYKGLEMLLNNKVKVMNVNYKKYNQKAVKQFENILN